MTKNGLYFEELLADKTYTTHRRTITEADHVNFTTTFGFFEPLFMDQAYVETQTHYGRRIVPGALLARQPRKEQRREVLRRLWSGCGLIARQGQGYERCDIASLNESLVFRHWYQTAIDEVALAILFE